MMSNKWLFFLFGFALACNQGAQKTEAPKVIDENYNVGLTFVFSKQPPLPASAPDGNWCRTPFPEAAVISADPANVNRRLFTLSGGPHKVTVDYGHIVASFVLKKSGKNIEIFTSDNYPECLSNQVNFSIAADGTTFRYDNKKHIDFEIQLIEQPNGTQIALEMAPGAGYGIIVRR